MALSASQLSSPAAWHYQVSQLKSLADQLDLLLRRISGRHEFVSVMSNTATVSRRNGGTSDCKRPTSVCGFQPHRTGVNEKGPPLLFWKYSTSMRVEPALRARDKP